MTRMRDTVEKICLLWMFIRSGYDEWRTAVWDRDLDSYYCCNGRECCCGGMTVREVMGLK